MIAMPMDERLALKLKELEDELARTQKNKATEFHIGILKSKIAKLKKELLTGGSGRGGGGPKGVRKAGDATVAMVGFPSVGKSTLMNLVTDADSKVGAYDFTTTDCVPGMLLYEGLHIQVFDIPGIITGAAQGKGRGREVLSYARIADLILVVLDINSYERLGTIESELHEAGIRINARPPNVQIVEQKTLEVKLPPKCRVSKESVLGALKEFKVFTGHVIIREDIMEDQFIDFLEGNRHYVPALYLVNKSELVGGKKLSEIRKALAPRPVLFISCYDQQNISQLKEMVFQNLGMIRVYSKPRLGQVSASPVVLKKGATISDYARKIRKYELNAIKYAVVSGKSVSFSGQKVGLDHALMDGDVVTLSVR